MSLKLPNDFTPEEIELFQYLKEGTDNLVDTSELYKVLDCDTDRFIVCYVFEIGYTRRSLERVLGLSKSEIHTRIKNIKAIIYRNYKLGNLVK
jgi:hypothetical protein